jgi:hypothetical protein
MVAFWAMWAEARFFTQCRRAEDDDSIVEHKIHQTQDTVQCAQTTGQPMNDVLISLLHYPTARVKLRESIGGIHGDDEADAFVNNIDAMLAAFGTMASKKSRREFADNLSVNLKVRELVYEARQTAGLARSMTDGCEYGELPVLLDALADWIETLFDPGDGHRD